MELDGETREKRQRVRAGQSREEVPFQRGAQGAGEWGALHVSPGAVRTGCEAGGEPAPGKQAAKSTSSPPPPQFSSGVGRDPKQPQHRGITWRWGESGAGGRGRRLSPSPGLARSPWTGTGTEGWGPFSATSSLEGGTGGPPRSLWVDRAGVYFGGGVIGILRKDLGPGPSDLTCPFPSEAGLASLWGSGRGALHGPAALSASGLTEKGRDLCERPTRALTAVHLCPRPERRAGHQALPTPPALA